jgi:two-component system OmpR family sensor kinase
MLMVLGATGTFVYLRFGAELNSAINADLRSRAGNVATEAGSESSADLLQLLILGGSISLLLASLAAYGVAVAALRPVDEMRAMAARVSSVEPDRRLPVPPTHDEIARLGVTLNAMLDRLGEALAHERRFVADASHELRTPLAILKTEVDLALSQQRSASELQAALASVSEETDRLIGLAEDLLTIAQTEQGELPVRLVATDIDEVLDAVARRFDRRARTADRALNVHVEPDLNVPVDRLRLDQALGNLIDNALRYGSGAIQLTATSVGDSLEIHVQDRGVGFATDFVDRAFERFSRADTSERDGGSGLGLSIVDVITRAHGGEAHAGNREGGGADVWLVLPIQRRENQTVSSPGPWQSI